MATTDKQRQFWRKWYARHREYAKSRSKAYYLAIKERCLVDKEFAERYRERVRKACRKYSSKRWKRMKAERDATKERIRNAVYVEGKENWEII